MQNLRLVLHVMMATQITGMVVTNTAFKKLVTHAMTQLVNVPKYAEMV